jgi:hypothetical protein
MHALKRNPILAVMLLLAALALAAEVWWLQQARQDAARARAALAQKLQERDWLARQSPALSEANEAALDRDVAQARRVLAALRTALRTEEGKAVAPPPPAKPIDAFFDIAGFIEKSRALAARAQVMIKPDERFGFATHANEGPEAELVPAVFQQRQLAQLLVEALLEARPRALLGVQREHPLTTAQRMQRNQAGPPETVAPAGGVSAGDFFDWSGPYSLRVPGRVESEAFRLEFTGQTNALRAFLNSVAAFPRPVIVRRIEVEPVASQSYADLQAAANAPIGAPVPLVTQNLSKFAVVVECVELLAAPEQSPP